MFERLIEAGLVKEKKYDNGLSVFKYTKKVFYDALWETDDLLLEARGMVIDTNTGEKVIWPFTKVFNYGENGAGDFLTDSTKVCAVQKINGFMAAARIWNHSLIVSTTGTLDSEYADMAREHIEKLKWNFMDSNLTYIFEICDERDPHVVEEEPGAYLIGAREMTDGCMVGEVFLDSEAEILGAKRPLWGNFEFSAVKELIKICPQEGFMIRSAHNGDTICKWKSPHYLTKKFIMRMGQKKVDTMYTDPVLFKQWIDEEYYDLVEWIVSNFKHEIWKDLDDQTRRTVIETYFNKGEE